MTVKVFDVIPSEALAEAAYGLYHTQFSALAPLAVQQHLMKRREFFDLLGDKRIDKYLALDDHDGLAGIAAYTTDLDAVDLISEHYFAANFPAHYAAGTIFYCLFVATRPPARGMPSHAAFDELVVRMYRDAAKAGGIIGLDLCRHNAEVRRMADVIETMLTHIDDKVVAHRADEQIYMIYETAPATPR